MPLSDKTNHLRSNDHKNKTKQHIWCEYCGKKRHLIKQDISKVKFTKPTQLRRELRTQLHTQLPTQLCTLVKRLK